VPRDAPAIPLGSQTMSRDKSPKGIAHAGLSAGESNGSLFLRIGSAGGAGRPGRWFTGTRRTLQSRPALCTRTVPLAFHLSPPRTFPTRCRAAIRPHDHAMTPGLLP
jgi:hypothetical protein